MQETVGRFDSETRAGIRMRIGVNTGEVLVGGAAGRGRLHRHGGCREHRVASPDDRRSGCRAGRARDPRRDPWGHPLRLGGSVPGSGARRAGDGLAGDRTGGAARRASGQDVGSAGRPRERGRPAEPRHCLRVRASAGQPPAGAGRDRCRKVPAGGPSSPIWLGDRARRHECWWAGVCRTAKPTCGARSATRSGPSSVSRPTPTRAEVRSRGRRALVDERARLG